MNENVFLGRQPILDRDQRLVAYELLFRDSATAQYAVIHEVSKASIQVIATTFANMGARSVLGDCRGFFNIATEVLMSDVLEALPHDRVTLEILETTEPTEAVARRCSALRKQGFVIALDDYVPGDAREVMLDVVDLVKVDLPGLDEGELRRLVRRLRSHSVQLLAEKVESPEQFEICRRLGFDLFQGYFFARPVVLEGNQLDSTRAALLELLRHVSNEAGQDLAIETLKRNANLSINLLNLVNSAAMPNSSTISHIGEALRYLGSRHLQRWVTLLLFAGDDKNGLHSPLFQLASRRGRLMELIVESSTARVENRRSDRAFLVGMLSLADVLLSRPIEEVTAELNLETGVERALIWHEGPLGRLLELVTSLEDFEGADYAGIEVLLEPFGLSMYDLQALDAEAYAWVHGLVEKQGQ